MRQCNEVNHNKRMPLLNLSLPSWYLPPGRMPETMPS